jgi:hypothetical protein
MKTAFPIARPATKTAAGTPARALAAIATIRTPGVIRAAATERAPRRCSRDDRKEGDDRLEVAAPGRDAGADDDEVARDRNRYPCLLHEDQAGQGKQRQGIGAHFRLLRGRSRIG